MSDNFVMNINKIQVPSAMEKIEEEEEEGQSHVQKRIKIEEIEEELEKSDRISALPDGLGVKILSRLRHSTDAFNTRELSKRWKYVWTGIPNLTFERPDYFPPNQKPPLSRFFSSVNLILSKRGQSKIKKFQLSTCYETQFESLVNKWIRYAISCNVEELSLRFRDVDHMDLRPSFIFDQSFYVNSCITHLTLAGCLLHPFEDIISWKNLRSLYIRHEELDDELIEIILSGCPLLETLNLEYCYGYGRLDITSKSVKNLVICGHVVPDYSDLYDYGYVGTVVEINAPSILSLGIIGELGLSKILLRDVSSLVKVDLDFEKERDSEGKRNPWRELRHHWEEQMLKGFILSLSHVNEVNIGFNCLRALSRLEAQGFKRPSNLKVLDVTLPLNSDDDVDELRETHRANGGYYIEGGYE